MSANQKLIPGMNGLRAISISIVVLSHIVIAFYPNLVNQKLPLFFNGFFGVNIFFVLSGFLITRLLLLEEIKYGFISLKNFFVRRVLRIFPAYYFLLFVYFIINRYGIIYIDISPNSWLTALTYTKYFNWNLDFETLHFWSLSVEEHFYVFWPLIFLAGKKTRNIFIVFVLIGIPMVRFYFANFHMEQTNFLSMTILFRIDAIIMGCGLAVIIEKQKRFEAIKKLNLKLGVFIIFSLLLIQFIPLWCHIKAIEVLRQALLGSFATLSNLAIAAIIVLIYFNPQAMVVKGLNTFILDWVGRLSYSIYLWQQLFLSGKSGTVFQLPWNILMILAIAAFSYYVIEVRILKFTKYFRKA